MKYAVVAALFALAAAQSRSDIPSCATPCLDDAVKSGTSCSTTDYSCICPKLDDLTIAATPCVLKACGQEVALQKVLPAAKALCAAAGSAPASGSMPATTASMSGSVSTVPTPATTVATPMSTSWSTVPCDTTSMVSMTPGGGNMTNPTGVPVAAGAPGLSAGVAVIALAVLAL